jgi:hypothetical protein
MFRFNCEILKLASFAFFCVLWSAPLFAASAAAEAVPAKSKSEVRKPPHRNPEARFTHFEVGLAYIQWNEKIKLTQGPLQSEGVANYAGPVITIDRNWTQRRWNWGAMAGLAAGKAAAGKFSGVSFTDSTDRPWYGLLLQPYVNFRINTHFMLGLGALSRLRTVDWSPADASIKVDARDDLVFAPQFNFRFNMWKDGGYDRLTLIQSFAPLGLDGETQWMWTGQYRF